METETPTTSETGRKQQDASIPHINLLCLHKRAATAFETATAEHFPQLKDHAKVTVHLGALHQLPKELKVDAIVSPANSFGRLDGAFDDAISRILSPRDDYHWTTRQVQKVLYKKYKGFAPPGTCTVIPLEQHDEGFEMVDEKASGENDGSVEGEEEEKDDASSNSKRKIGPHFTGGIKYILLCPTMRIPQEVMWDREVIYECIWTMLCAIQEHNESVTEDNRINSILMTPLATGVGLVPYSRWAAQCVLAMKHWIEATNNPEKWSNLRWGKILTDADEVSKTWREVK